MLDELSQESEESLNTIETHFKETKLTVKERLKDLAKRIEDCIIEQIKIDFTNPFQVLLTECVGMNYDILNKEFDDMMLDVIEVFKQITIDLLEPFKEGNEDCLKHFMSCLEFLTERDFKVIKGFYILEKKTRYYVPNPKVFRDFLEITKTHFEKWDVFLNYMINIKKDVKQMLKDKLRKREEALEGKFKPDKKTEFDAGKEHLDGFKETENSEKNFMNEFEEINNETKLQEDDWANAEESESTEQTEFSSEDSGAQEGQKQEGGSSKPQGSNPNRYDARDQESASSSRSSESSKKTEPSIMQDDDALKQMIKEKKDEDEDLNPPPKSI